MSPVTCHYCGLPFKVRRADPGREYFCCTGCAMLSRVPVDAQGQFPVNAHLVAALTTGFLFFNQLLCWLVGVLLVREGRMAVALRFFWLADAAALAVWLALAFLLWKQRTARAADCVLMVAAAAVFVFAHRQLPPVLQDMAVVNLVLLGWNFRGVLRKKKA